MSKYFILVHYISENELLKLLTTVTNNILIN